MENFAQTMRNAANTFNDKKEEAKKVRHEEYVRETVVPAIEAVAHNGGYHANLAIPRNIEWTMVKDILTEGGFTVGSLTKYRTLYVAW